MIYAVVNTKGGVGKNHHGRAFGDHAGANRPNLADRRRSAGECRELGGWAAWRRDAQRDPSPTTTCLAGKAILSEGKTLSEGFRHTVVDAGGRDSVSLRSALLLARQAIVPVGASNLDAAAMTDLLEVIDMAKDYNSELQVRIFLTRVDSRTKDAAEMLAFLHEQKLPVLSCRACERVAYRRAIGEGAIVQELGKDPSASQEMETFLAEVAA
jgi:chromosome partitioning protein